MIFRFGEFELDVSRQELRADGEVRHLQPQVFALLELLARNADRLVSKDELVEAIWDRRFVSDAAVSSCVRLARNAVDDDGRQQRIIKTVHGSGFRLVADVALIGEPARPANPHARADSAVQPPASVDRPTIAILPFTLLGSDPGETAIAEAVPAELIATLSRLRWLKVIARGSSFRFRDGAANPDEIGAKLGAGYLITGTVELEPGSLSVLVELSDARRGLVVWTERFSGKHDEVLNLRERIARDVANALELHIHIHESEQFRLVPSEDLSAWAHYHLGVRHMYRYNPTDNLVAEDHFQKAIQLDPYFARAQAARSYTEFQNHFQMFGGDLDRHKSLALEHAEQAVALDPLDPFCTLMLGRAKWLFGEIEDGLGWVDRSLALNPNYAFGFYNNALLNTVLCDGQTAATNVDTALDLSPLDPHLQSMLGTRAMAAYVSDDLPAATRFIERAMRAPNPHLYVYMIAALIYAQSGTMEKAHASLDKLRSQNPAFGKAQFLEHYDLRDPDRKRRMLVALNELQL